MKYIILVLVIVYIYRICIHSFRFRETLIMINLYADQVDVYREIIDERSIKETDFYPLIEKNPKFNSLSNGLYWNSKIDYGMSNRDLLEGISMNQVSLMKLRDKLNFGFREVLNPLNTLIYLFQLPGKLFKSMGIKLSKRSQIIISIFTYLITYILAMFQAEIKQLILGMFQ